MDLGLDGRVYIVTGGSSGLGLATATALVAEGARVVISARTEANVEAAVADLGGADHAVGLSADNANAGTADRLVDLAKSSYGALHGACISVGGPPPGSPTSTTDEQWLTSFESVFLGAVRLARAVAASIDSGGSIGFVLSSSAKSPVTGLAISNGLRPGLAMLAKDLADELGPRGIRVLSLLPGRILTARTLSLTPDEDARNAIAASVPLRRYGDADEFGRVAAFLLSPAASYVSGCAVPVDGGLLRAL